MHSIARVLFLGGFLVAILAQLYIVIRSFKVRTSAGLFCLFITPIYAFVSEDLRHNEKIRPALKVWLGGFCLALFSIILLGTG